MRDQWGIGALAAALALAATAAQADPLFDLYQSMCVKTAGGRAPAIAAAEAQGWTAPAADQAKQLAALFGDGSGDMRLQLTERRLLLVGQKGFPLGQANINVEFCAVGGVPAENSDLAAQVAKFAGVAPFPAETSVGATAYVFSDDGGAHTRIDNPGDDKAMAAVIASGRLRLVLLQPSGPLTVVIYALPAK